MHDTPSWLTEHLKFVHTTQLLPLITGALLLHWMTVVKEGVTFAESKWEKYKSKWKTKGKERPTLQVHYHKLIYITSHINSSWKTVCSIATASTEAKAKANSAIGDLCSIYVCIFFNSS